MKTNFSNGAFFVDTGSLAMKRACAYMHMHDAGRSNGKNHDINELDSGYCIDAPAWMPAGSMYRSAEGNIWEQVSIRRNA